MRQRGASSCAPDHTPATPDQSRARARFPDQRPCPFPIGARSKRANDESAPRCGLTKFEVAARAVSMALVFLVRAVMERNKD